MTVPGRHGRRVRPGRKSATARGIPESAATQEITMDKGKKKKMTDGMMREAAAGFGRRGGMETVRRHGREHMSRIAKLSVEARRNKSGAKR